jgi:hypothetical protein
LLIQSTLLPLTGCCGGENFALFTTHKEPVSLTQTYFAAGL